MITTPVVVMVAKELFCNRCGGVAMEEGQVDRSEGDQHQNG